MSHMLATVAGNPGFRIGLVATAFGFGLRHGIDWDHIAALTDIGGSQTSSRRSMLLATLYALGHALVVLVLGVLAIVGAAQLPQSVDGVMERVVGATLLVLGVYVFVSLARNGRDFRLRSRWTLVLAGVQRAARWLRSHPADLLVIEHEHEHPVDEVHAHDDAHVPVHERLAVAVGGAHSPGRSNHRHRHRHIAVMPDDPLASYGRGTAFGIGMIHGIGAETPTQLLIFLTAAGAGGTAAGIALLGCFIAGLLTSNSLIALASSYGFLGASRNFPLYVTISVITAVFSLAIGTLFVLGQATVLPAFFGG